MHVSSILSHLGQDVYSPRFTNADNIVCMFFVLFLAVFGVHSSTLSAAAYPTPPRPLLPYPVLYYTWCFSSTGAPTTCVSWRGDVGLVPKRADGSGWGHESFRLKACGVLGSVWVC